MNKIKVIKTEQDYKEALALAETLMGLSPDPDSEDGEKLSLLTTLIADYETARVPESLPDPVDAILFRMEQANLKPADLIPFIGSRSKVSEILSRKRPLTVSMMRALEAGLGIPAKVLLKEPDEFRDPENVAWEQFPLQEMEKRGYFGRKSLKDSDAKSLIVSFFNPMGSYSYAFGMLRKSNYVRAVRPMDKHALAAWSGFIVRKAQEIEYPVSYKKGTVNLTFMQEIAKLSVETDGPVRAIEFLKAHGIGLIVEPHFSQTYLDGAVIMTDKKHPVIGLTIRYDRVDNFWFTLIHELAHIALHYDTKTNLFYDDLDNKDTNELEAAADQLAGEALIPENKWENSPARLIPSPMAAESLAKEIGVHTAIVAGKMRRTGERYQFLNTIVNKAKVRQYFPTVDWDK
jgi:HTH-type transcriptional regulator/antitoxin HigA